MADIGLHQCSAGCVVLSSILHMKQLHKTTCRSYHPLPISHSLDGAVALVASALTGRTWDGAVWAYGSLSELTDMAPEILPIIATTMPSGGWVFLLQWRY